MGKKIIYDQKTENDIIAYYQAGYSLKDCGKKFFNNESNYRIVRRILLKNEIHLRTFAESKSKHYENVQKTVKSKYNVNNISQLAETKQKVKNTCMKKYGVDNPGKIQAGKDKAKQTCLQKYGVDHFTKTDIWKRLFTDNYDNWLLKTKQTCLQKYGVDWIFKSDKIKINIIQTKRKHNTFHASNPEELLYERLCAKFGIKNVIRQYADFRYPFACDFYVKSEDLFIELNLSWTHGTEPFIGNKKQLELLRHWEEKAKDSRYYKIAIDVWTKKDPKKIGIATKNNINYWAIYKNEYDKIIKEDRIYGQT